MRLKTCLLIFFFVSLIANCQESGKTPNAVKKTFQTVYHGENDPDWHADSNGNYEANFKMDGEKYRADYKPSGEWIETENSIKTKNLPKAILDKIATDYSECEITEVEHVDSALKGFFYDVEFKQEGKNLDVEFDEKGNVL